MPELERTCPNLKVVLTMTDDEDWDGEKRKVDAEFLRDHLEGALDGYIYLVAGPPDMVNGVVETLNGAGIPGEQIKPDRYSGY